MKITRTADQQRTLSGDWRKKGLKIGFVPTMGALHEAHLSLVRKSFAVCDRTVVSIFVNPIQFAPKEDLAKYPRPFSRDRAMLRRAGVHALFAPCARAMYPRGFASGVEVTGPLASRLCGPFRPGHFRGVTTIVAKLLNAVTPDVLFLGQKDAQQARIITRMARDLDFGLKVSVLPTVREEDGLALSSRNRYLNRAQRLAAPILFEALRAGRSAIMAGESRADRVRRVIRARLATRRLLRIQYVDIVDHETLEPVTRLRGRVLLALAARLGGTRLIDNLIVRVPRR